MARILLIVFACATPLCASGLAGLFYPDKREAKIAREWYTHFQDWADAQSGDGLWTWFSDDDGAPARFLIDRVDARAIHARQLFETGQTDAEGEPERVPALEATRFKWKDWRPEFMLSTYPVTTNDDDKDLVGCAIWLYESGRAMLANRVLTVLHGRNESLREAIEDYIRERQKLKKAELTPYRLWDDDFRVYRDVLISGDLAEKLEKARTDDAKKRFHELKRQYHDVERRGFTLAGLVYQLKKWREDFAGLEIADKHSEELKKLIASAERDIAKVGVHVDVAATYLIEDEVDWRKVAETYEAALKLDPYDLSLISKAADAWFKHANPHIWAAKKRVVSDREGDLPSAIALYEKRLARQPANVKVMYNLALCHQARGNRDAAHELYNRIIRRDSDAALTRQAAINLELD